MRRRLDLEMVRRGVVASRQAAQAEIRAGRVRVAGTVADKAARLVAPAEPIVVVGPPPRFVSRGGDKLAPALDRFGVAVAGRRAVDLGASTGGFTDVLLQRGAGQVVAVDVGHGQLHERLRGDERVVVRERTNARELRPGDLGPPAELLVADLSFISLRTVLPAALALCAPGADVVLLVKPQFEAGRREVARGRGVVTDPVVWRRTLLDVGGALTELGAAIMGVMVSPLVGAEGNVEFLLHATAAGVALPGDAPAREAATSIALQAAVDAAVDEARSTHGAA